MKKIFAILVLLLMAAPAFADGARRVEIQVSGDGYKPATVSAKPGEKLVLVFKAAGDPGCCGSIVVPAANFRGSVDKAKPLEVAVTMPASGKVTFACSMNMCKGEVVPGK